MRPLENFWQWWSKNETLQHFLHPSFMSPLARTTLSRKRGCSTKNSQQSSTFPDVGVNCWAPSRQQHHQQLCTSRSHTANKMATHFVTSMWSTSVRGDPRSRYPETVKQRGTWREDKRQRQEASTSSSPLRPSFCPCATSSASKTLL